MIDLKIEVTTEIWRTDDTTFIVMYPFPDVAYIKKLRGKFDRELRNMIKTELTGKGITLIHYEGRKGGRCYTVALENK